MTRLNPAVSRLARFVPHSWQLLFFIIIFCLISSHLLLHEILNFECSQRRKTSNKPRDASTPSGSTAAESVRNLIKKNPKYSKRINYNALKDLFVDPDEKGTGDATGMFTIEGEVEVIEEGGAVSAGIGQVPMATTAEQADTAGDITDGIMDDDDADGEEEGSDKGDDTVGPVWEDVYEQEV